MKNIAEKIPSWVEKFLLPDLESRIRTIVKAEIDRVMRFEETLRDIDKRLAVLENNPFIIASKHFSIRSASVILEGFEKKMRVNPLTAEELQLRKELTIKLERKTITPDEARQLHDILNKELEEASKTNEFLAILAILFLLGLVVAILSR